MLVVASEIDVENIECRGEMATSCYHKKAGGGMPLRRYYMTTRYASRRQGIASTV